MKGKLAIITINLNNAEGLKRTIESVIIQSNQNFQFIVIDGNSTDGSKDLLKHFQTHFFYCVSEVDNGIYEAMNKGIAAADADYYLFLNSGDWLHNEHVIQRTVEYLHTYDVISGDIDIYDNNRWHEMQSEDKIDIELFLRLSLYHQATFISSQLFEKFGMYDFEFKSAGDFEFFIRVFLIQNASYLHIPIKISKFIADGMSNNINMAQLNLQEREKSWKKHFGNNVMQLFRAKYDLEQSWEMNWAKRINKRLPF